MIQIVKDADTRPWFTELPHNLPVMDSGHLIMG